MSHLMLRDVLLTLVLAGALHAAHVEAASPACACWKGPAWLGMKCGCCPDDYCAKPLPGLPCPPAQCCPDNYCAKPLPAIPCDNCEKSCACYDIKPLPPVPRCCEPWYKCIPFCGGK